MSRAAVLTPAALMHELLRQFAAEQLAEACPIYDAYSRYFVTFAVQCYSHFLDRQYAEVRYESWYGTARARPLCRGGGAFPPESGVGIRDWRPALVSCELELFEPHGSAHT